MARFTNYATLTYTGGTTDSNTVTGELLETLAAVKTAVVDRYTARDRVTYVVSLTNTGTAALTDLTVSDDLGGYTAGTQTVYPLAFMAGSVRYYVGGVLQPAPTVEAGPPLTVTGVTVPAGGNAILIYEAEVTAYAPMGTKASITNTATVTGPGLANPVTAQETVTMEQRAELNISKALTPITVTENGKLTYTFVIENTGALAADAAEQVVLTDTFDPRLANLVVTLNGTALTEGTQYTYNNATGLFETAAGVITVPAATYAQNADGTWAVTPGVATVTVTGTV